MAVRQYIGARYVPRFCGTYDNTQSYEALDVVDNGSGTSYIARKTVPANTPLINTDYWFLYGAASGAIVQLQNDVIQLQNDVLGLDSDIIKNVGGFAGEDITKKHFLFMGDSYLRGTICTGLNPNTYTHDPEDGWGYKAAQMLGLDTDHYESILTGGASFALTNGVHWQDTLSTYTFTQDPDEIDAIVLLGGANDRYESGADIRSGIDAFFNVARTRCPNATIMIGFIGYARHAGEIAGQRTAFTNYFLQTVANGGVFLPNLENVAQTGNLMGIDDLHPTAGGYSWIAREAANSIRGASPDFITEYDLTFTPSNSGDTITAIGRAYIHNEYKKLTIPHFRVDPAGTTNINLNPSYGYDFDIATINAPFMGDANYPVIGHCQGFITHTGGTYAGSFQVWLKDGHLYLHGAEYDNGSWVTLYDVGVIQLFGITLQSDGLSSC